jgi:hypothetical protein
MRLLTVSTSPVRTRGLHLGPESEVWPGPPPPPHDSEQTISGVMDDCYGLRFKGGLEEGGPDHLG